MDSAEIEEEMPFEEKVKEVNRQCFYHHGRSLSSAEVNKVMMDIRDIIGRFDCPDNICKSLPFGMKLISETICNSQHVASPKTSSLLFDVLLQLRHLADQSQFIKEWRLSHIMFLFQKNIRTSADCLSLPHLVDIIQLISLELPVIAVGKNEILRHYFGRESDECNEFQLIDTDLQEIYVNYLAECLLAVDDNTAVQMLLHVPVVAEVLLADWAGVTFDQYEETVASQSCISKEDILVNMTEVISRICLLSVSNSELFKLSISILFEYFKLSKHIVVKRCLQTFVQKVLATSPSMDRFVSLFPSCVAQSLVFLLTDEHSKVAGVAGEDIEYVRAVNILCESLDERVVELFCLIFPHLMTFIDHVDVLSKAILKAVCI